MTTEMVNIDTASEIVTERRGNAGLITLNRPKALNALSLPMVRDLLGILHVWRDDLNVRLVAIRGTNKTAVLERLRACSAVFAQVAISAFSIRRRWQAMLHWITFLLRNTPSTT